MVKKIIILCAMGMSTSLFVNKIYKALEKKNNTLEIHAYSENEIFDHIEDTDLVLLAPQIAYMEDEIKKECEKHNKPCISIPMNVYASFDESIICNFINPLIL